MRLFGSPNYQKGAQGYCRPMAKLTVKIDVPLPPQEVWDKASDLSGYENWLVVHDGWRSDLPENAQPDHNNRFTQRGLCPPHALHGDCA